MSAVSFIHNNVDLLYDISLSLPFTFSMLALPCSKTHKMKGFVTMEKVILSILLMLWQVSVHLSKLVSSIIILSWSAWIVSPFFSFCLSFLSCSYTQESEKVTSNTQMLS